MFWELFTVFTVTSIWSACTPTKQFFPVTKPLPILLLLGVVLLQFSYSTFNVAVLCGLSFGLLGDILLLRKSLFMAGLASFLIGNSFYAYAFSGLEWRLPTEWTVGLLVPYAIYGVVTGNQLIKRGDFVFLTAVMTYLSMLAIMVLMASNYDTVHNSAIPYAMIGTSLFTLSDAAICWERVMRPLPLGTIIILGLYYAAQAMIIRGSVLSAGAADELLLHWLKSINAF
eukprot:TRINITY_DN30969_c0_g1_i1.p1 TRINITY_DN30969_c0_g1~~TRINITY_DN30969_c0_g1_i1.p1  ORF type:complete len:228 (+),score=71.09 TRINITY_DN30969_c0_g1_i1:176-859(+)